jgi:branched-chain amino acid transport system permease protein
MQQLANGLVIGSTYSLVALGFGLVFSVMRVLNMAHPDFVMIGAYAAYLVIRPFGFVATMPMIETIGILLLALTAGMAAAGAAGILVERIVIRPTRGTYVLIPFIATAAVGIFLENGAQRIFGSDPVAVPSALRIDIVEVSGVTVTTVQIATFATAVAMMLVVRTYVRHTRLGLASRALAERPAVSAACGVNVNVVSMTTIGIASMLAGAAGVTLGVLYQSAAPTMGLLYGLKAFVCMLVAGNRHIEGIMAVGLALGIMETLVSGYVSTSYRDAVAFGLLLAILVFRPNGIFGSYET